MQPALRKSASLSGKILLVLVIANLGHVTARNTVEVDEKKENGEPRLKKLELLEFRFASYAIFREMPTNNLPEFDFFWQKSRVFSVNSLSSFL